jgi:predicted  nucleic acid-binding Zn-ribbon protein
MKFTHIRLRNFCKHNNFETDLYNITSISGCNEVGKSTIKRAIYWILNLKDENGKEITGIRPHDSEGKDIDDVVTEVELALDSGITLKKSHYQKRNKKGEITGNVTDCYVSDIPKQSGEYAKYVSEIIPSDLCVNPYSFLRMDTSKRRELLENTFGKFTNVQIVDMFSEFEPIRALLQVGSVKEIKQSCNDKIHGSKARNIVGLEQQRDEKISAIKELETHKIDIDVAELELSRNAIKEQLKENKAKQDDLSKQMEEIDKASDGILELKFQVNDLIRQANEENSKYRLEIENKLSEKRFLADKTNRTIKDTEKDIIYVKREIKENRIDVERLREKYKDTQDLEFDENSLICQYCGQEYPSEKKDELRAEFESHREEKLKSIEESGNRLKSEIEVEQETLRTLELELAEHKKSLEMLNTAIADLRNQFCKLPPLMDIVERTDIVELNNQIAEKEKAMKESNSFFTTKQNLKDEENDLRSQLLEIEKQIAKSESNVAIDERIAELQKEQREISQKIADEERTLNYLKEFDRKKNELLEESVNNNFEYIQFKMFEPQINGELKDICQPVVNGESYDRNLNHGAKILAEIDICRAFQRANNVTLPIITDDTESLDSWRVPEMDNQIIMIRRSDDEKLTVSEV